MPVRLTNRTRGLLTVELNSGGSVHLAPGETSAALDEVLTQDNAVIDKLRDRADLGVQQGRSASRKSTSAKSTGKRARKR